MSRDPYLIERIKENFARKSSAQLRLIAQTDDHEHWSAEAVEAAGQVLLDRETGRAEEPVDVEDEEPPPSSDHTANDLAFLAGVGLLMALSLGGVGVLRVPRRVVDDPVARDQPVPFGPGIAWLAVNTTDTEGVATALGLRDVREATWAEGVEEAHRSSIFVTPPLGDWTLAVSTALFPPERVGEFVKLLTEQLSRQFLDAQYFCTHRDAGLHAWGRAVRGRLLRGYARLDSRGVALWDEGNPTKAEQFLGFSSRGGQPANIATEQRPEGAQPDEAGVMRLASFWSIDPTAIDENFKEPILGLLGMAGWSTAEPGTTPGAGLS